MKAPGPRMRSRRTGSLPSITVQAIERGWIKAPWQEKRRVPRTVKPAEWRDRREARRLKRAAVAQAVAARIAANKAFFKAHPILKVWP